MKVDPESRKRLLFGGLLPFALMITSLPIAAELRTSTLRNVGSGLTSLRFDADEIVNESEPTAQAAVSKVKEEDRREALGVVERWESEHRMSGGRLTVTPQDIEQLRRAIL